MTGRIEIDDAYLGGERSGGKRGRGAPGKTPFVAAVETTTEGKPVRLKLRRVTSFCASSIAGFAKRSLDPDCSVVSDGLQCFASVADAGCVHQVVKTGSGPKAARTPAFKWVNTALGNIKAAITGTYRAINSKHVPRYLAEFEYRFNRRYDLAAMIPRLTWAAVRTTPKDYPFGFIQRYVIRAAIVELRRPCAGMVRHRGAASHNFIRRAHPIRDLQQQIEGEASFISTTSQPFTSSVADVDSC